jgi:3-oxoacyl-[acyl-carrier-protein] synthase-3
MKPIAGVAVRAIAAAVPTLIARTQDYEFLTPDERQRFQKVTGIAERHIARDGQFASDFSAAAAIRIIEHLD